MSLESNIGLFRYPRNTVVALCKIKYNRDDSLIS